MSDILTQKELEELAELGNNLLGDLDCGLEPICRTCRLDAVELMKKYLKIHDYEVIQK